jgi:hypothetical protein
MLLKRFLLPTLLLAIVASLIIYFGSNNNEDLINHQKNQKILASNLSFVSNKLKEGSIKEAYGALKIINEVNIIGELAYSGVQHQDVYYKMEILLHNLEIVLRDDPQEFKKNEIDLSHLVEFVYPYQQGISAMEIQKIIAQLEKTIYKIQTN